LAKHDTIRRIVGARILLVLDADQNLLETARGALDAGVVAVEIPAKEGADGVSAIVRAGMGLIVGAGGVTTAGQAWDAVEAGANMVSAAPLDAEIAAVCEAADVATVAVAAEMADVAQALTLRPDFLRLTAALVPSVAADTPVIIDAPMPADSPPGAVLAVSLRFLDVRSPEELRAHLSELIASTTNPSAPGIS
jgi:hypothetical protein